MVLPTLLCCHLFVWTFLWNTGLLVLRLLLSPLRGAAACSLLAAYVVP